MLTRVCSDHRLLSTNFDVQEVSLASSFPAEVNVTLLAGVAVLLGGGNLGSVSSDHLSSRSFCLIPGSPPGNQYIAAEEIVWSTVTFYRNPLHTGPFHAVHPSRSCCNPLAGRDSDHLLPRLCSSPQQMKTVHHWGCNLFYIVVWGPLSLRCSLLQPHHAGHRKMQGALLSPSSYLILRVVSAETISSNLHLSNLQILACSEIRKPDTIQKIRIVSKTKWALH